MNKSKTPNKPLKELPVLPRGEGVFRYINNGNDIRYEKYIVLEPFNNRKRLSVTGKTPQQCRAKMKEREAKALEKARQEYKHSSDNPTVTLFDALIDWCNNNSHNMKATSIDRRQRTVENQIQDSRIGRQQVQELSSEDIEEYFHWLQFEATTNKGEKGYSFSVVRKAYDILKSFFSDYYSKDMDNNPMNSVKRPVENKDTKEYSDEDLERLGEPVDLEMVLSDDEIKAFKEFVYQKPKIGSEGRSKYGLAIFFVMMTFLRTGEARSLRWKDIDFENKRVYVNKSISRIKNRSEGEEKTKNVITSPKTRAGRREVFLTDEAKDAILKYKELSKYTDPSDFIFYTDNKKIIGESQLWRTVQGILIGAGLKKDQKTKKKRNNTESAPPIREGFSMHYLRHTGISYYLRHGVPIEVISKMAGHSSIRVTQNIYYHIIEDQKQDALDKMNEIKL